MEPLTLEELGKVIAIRIEGDPWYDPTARFPGPKDLL